MNKYQKLCEIGLARKNAISIPQKNDWTGYKSIADFHNGAYDCEYVSPYTKCAPNADASIFVVLQDWSSDQWLSGPLDYEVQRLGYSPSLPTNINLKELLKNHLEVELEEVFATNLFPFVKSGNLSTAIPAKLMQRAAKEFCIPQIEIVNPKIVICMGTTTFNAIRQSKGLRNVKNMQDGFEHPFMEKDTEYWCQAHPGSLGRINRQYRGGPTRVDMDWADMAKRHRELITLG